MDADLEHLRIEITDRHEDDVAHARAEVLRERRDRIGEIAEIVGQLSLRAAFAGFHALPQQRGLPSAPPCPVIYMTEPNRPQPRKDAERHRGMAAFVGRLRPCPVLDWKFVVLSHNTIRGAAGAAVLNAELMQSEGMLE